MHTPAIGASSSNEKCTVRVCIFLPGASDDEGQTVCGDSFSELFDELGLPSDSNLRFSLQQPTSVVPQPPALSESSLWSLMKNTKLYAFPYFCITSFITQLLVNPRLQMTELCGLCIEPLSNATHHPPSAVTFALTSTGSVTAPAATVEVSAADVRTVRVRVILPGLTEEHGVTVCGDSFEELLRELNQSPNSNFKFSLLAPTEAQPQPPALTESQLWGLAKNTILFVYRAKCSLPRHVQQRINPQLELTNTCVLCGQLLSHSSH